MARPPPLPARVPMSPRRAEPRNHRADASGPASPRLA